jgi:uncharacterized membrane protein YphA (DoxX/SURF4 family)
MDPAAPYLKLMGRVLLCIMFIQSGAGKISAMPALWSI